MKYVKNLVTILLLAQCLLLFCVCDKKEIVTTEQNILNLANFVKCPFNEEFDDKINLEKYVLKKFGKPNRVSKVRGTTGEHSGVVVDKIGIEYENYSFSIYRGIEKRFEVFKEISMLNYTDLKYGINEETTMRDIENLFGKPELRGRDEEVQSIQQKGSAAYSYTGFYNYYYEDNDKSPYRYRLDIGFTKGKLGSISVNTLF